MSSPQAPPGPPPSSNDGPARIAPVPPREGSGKGPHAFDFLFDMTRVPCFRRSGLMGMTIGALLGGTNFWRNRIPVRAVDVFVKGSVVAFLATWTVCRVQYRNQRRAMIEMMESQSVPRDRSSS